MRIRMEDESGGRRCNMDPGRISPQQVCHTALAVGDRPRRGICCELSEGGDPAAPSRLATASTQHGPGRDGRKRPGTNCWHTGRTASGRPLTVRLDLPGPRCWLLRQVRISKRRGWDDRWTDTTPELQGQLTSHGGSLFRSVAASTTVVARLAPLHIRSSRTASVRLSCRALSWHCRSW